MRAHGTNARYRLGPDEDDRPGNGGCKCDPCRAAGRAYHEMWKNRTVPTMVGADEARRHIEYLQGEGIGLKQIAKRSGVPHGSISKLIYGDPARGMAPSRRIRRETHEKILAVAPSQGAEGARIDAGPTWAVVDRLLARGWTKAAIGRAIGQGGPALQLGRKEVTRRNAQAIKALLDQPVPPRTTNRGTTWQPTPEPEPVEEPAERDDRDWFVTTIAEILERRIDENGWRRRAACRGKPPWMFFPGRGDHRTEAAAKKICATCPVKAECLAANATEKVGIYGGESANQRRQRRFRAA